MSKSQTAELWRRFIKKELDIMRFSNDEFNLRPHMMIIETPQNPEETSLEVQNRGISGPTKRTYVLQIFFKSLCAKAGISLHAWAHISLSTGVCISLHVGVQRGIEHHGGLRRVGCP